MSFDPRPDICHEVSIGSYRHGVFVQLSWRGDQWMAVCDNAMEKMVQGELSPAQCRLLAMMLLSAAEEIDGLNAVGVKGWPWRERDMPRVRQEP